MGIVSTDSEFIKAHVRPSKNKLQFIYEAIINSLEASNDKKVQIRIVLNFSRLLNDTKKLEQADIIDKGNGFTEKSYERFRVWGDRSKKKNNRGSGRMQFYHDFEEVEIVSLFKEKNNVRKRTFAYDSDNFEEAKTHKTEELNSDEELTTCVSLKKYRGNDKSISTLTIDDFVDLIQSNLLLRFYLEKKSGIEINIKVEFRICNETEEREISNTSLQSPTKEGEMEVYYEKVMSSNNKLEFELTKKKEVIKWAHFKIETDYFKGNEIKLCSKNIPVFNMKFDGLDTACKCSESKYLTVFYGDLFDRAENVNDSVDGFKFPSKKDFKKEEQYLFEDEFLFFDSIKDKIKNELPCIYGEIQSKIDGQKSNAQELAKIYGIDQKYADEIEINIADQEKDVVEKLYCSQAKKLSEKAIQVREIEEKLNSIKPTDNDYEKKLRELTEKRLQLTMEQDREELSKYVIRRDFIVKLLQKILNEELDWQNENGKRRDKEGIIHDLFFKRRTGSERTNDLWILNEDFLYYQGYSDVALNQIKMPDGNFLFDVNSIEEDEKELLKRRPDVYLFAEEKACVVIEFKEKDENLADHVQQIRKYCHIIANRGRLKIKKFFCYLIGEKLIEKDLGGEYKKTIHGDMCSEFEIPSFDNADRSTIAFGQLEIIRLSSLKKRAENRNNIFAEKLRLI
jgi:hypothetical protein